MGLALLLNVVVLLAIVIILIQKLQTENSAESKKIWLVLSQIIASQNVICLGRQ
jgi:hypothetical protein